jgi:drug/metabolite transporter (DMT)-like permease
MIELDPETESEPADLTPAAAPRPATWIITSAVFFAVMSAFAHALGTRCDWLTVALVRAVFMFGAAVALVRAAGAELVVWRPRTLWMRSLAGTFSLVCSFYALSTRLPLGDFLTLSNSYPLWIAALSWVSARRAPAVGEVLGVACGMAGVVLIGRPHLSGDHLAAAVALTGSFSTAVAMIGLHKLRGVDARAVVAHFAGVASLVTGAALLVRGPAVVVRTSAGFDARTLLMLAGVGLAGTAGQVFLTRAYAAGRPTRVAVLGLTQVVFGLALDVLVWGRTLPASALAGTALVLAPTAWLLTRTGSSEPAAPRARLLTAPRPGDRPATMP